MAIYRLNGSNDVSVTALVSFLNENKAVTFLADATIEESTDKFSVGEADYGNMLKITKGNTVIEVGYCQATDAGSVGTYPMARLSTVEPATGIYGISMSLPSGLRTGKFLRGNVIMCAHGILFTVNTYWQTTHLGNRVPFGVFDDGNGGLGLIGGNIAVTSQSAEIAIPTYIGYKIAGSYDAGLTLVPNYNIQATNIVPCTFVKPNNFGVSNYVHLALQTQWVSGTDNADSVHGNGADYIANGKIYIKD